MFSLFIRPIREILLIHTRILHNKHRIFLFFLANLYEYFSAIFFFFRLSNSYWKEVSFVDDPDIYTRATQRREQL